jgi:hypothetical protein
MIQKKLPNLNETWKWFLADSDATDLEPLMSKGRISLLLIKRPIRIIKDDEISFERNLYMYISSYATFQFLISFSTSACLVRVVRMLYFIMQ